MVSRIHYGALTRHGMAVYPLWQKYMVGISDRFCLREDRCCLEASFVPFVTNVADLDLELIAIMCPGWSLGGLVSLEIAKILQATNPPIEILGIIMIDSPFPGPWRLLRETMIKPDVDFPAHTSKKVRKSIEQRFDECDRIVDEWKLTDWGSPPDQGVANDINEAEKRPYLQERKYYHIPSSAETPKLITLDSEGTEVVEDMGSSFKSHLAQISSRYIRDVRERGRLPPCALIRATERLPRPASDPNALIDLDICRRSKLLGWDAYPYDFIKLVFDIPGDHFKIFDSDARV